LKKSNLKIGVVFEANIGGNVVIKNCAFINQVFEKNKCINFNSQL
jgi:hypothetical protein